MNACTTCGSPWLEPDQGIMRCTDCGRRWPDGADTTPPRPIRSATLARYDPTIRVPDGRLFRGRRPYETRPGGEGPYIAALAEAVHGLIEVRLPAGRADVATGDVVFEVEPARSWRVGAQQAFGYAGMTGLRPALALFGPAEYLDIYLRVRDKMPPLALWRWCGDVPPYGSWHEVTNRRIARWV